MKKKAEEKMELNETPSTQTFPYKVDEKVEGSLFIRTNGRAEFYPKTKRSSCGMVTTERSQAFTIQESSKKIKITFSFAKDGLKFEYVLKQITKLVTTLQKMNIV